MRLEGRNVMVFLAILLGVAEVVVGLTLIVLWTVGITTWIERTYHRRRRPRRLGKLTQSNMKQSTGRRSLRPKTPSQQMPGQSP